MGPSEEIEALWADFDKNPEQWKVCLGKLCLAYNRNGNHEIVDVLQRLTLDQSLINTEKPHTVRRSGKYTWVDCVNGIVIIAPPSEVAKTCRLCMQHFVGGLNKEGV